MTSAPSWRTGRRGESCAACGRAFAAGESVVSSLHETESPPDADAAGDGAPAFARRDACDACAADVTAAAESAAAYSWWRWTVPAPEQKRAAFDLGVAREFLVRLLREDEPARAPLRYLLALLLLRKRVVRVDEQFRDERGEVLSLRIPPDETVWEIVAVELDEAATESLREQLGQLFDLGD